MEFTLLHLSIRIGWRRLINGDSLVFGGRRGVDEKEDIYKVFRCLLAEYLLVAEET